MTLQTEWTIEGGRFLPQAYINMSLAINDVFRNIEIGMLRADAHMSEEDKRHPFCLMMVNADGSVQPVKYLKESDMNLGLLMQWLKNNGTTDKTAEEHFQEYLHGVAKQAESEKKLRDAATAEEADLLASIYCSPLHTYRHNGNNIGADNNVPTLMKKEGTIL